MIHKFSVHPAATERVLAEAAEAGALGLPDLRTWRDYYIEFAQQPGPQDLAAVAALFGDGKRGTVVHIDQPLPAGTAVQVAYRRGVVDNESDSIVAACLLLGLSARAGKVATTYASTSPQLAAHVRTHRWNRNCEDFHDVEPTYDSLEPTGQYLPVQYFDLRGLAEEQLKAIGLANGRNLDLDKMLRIQRLQQTTGHLVSDVLLEALDARWSDHCLHTTWKSLGDLLSRLVSAAESTRNPNILSMFHDNAGVWSFYDGFALAIKAETHNGPSAVSAYFGQLTKLGGVLRDILGTGLGADPIGCFEYTATGLPGTAAPIEGRPTPKRIALETIRAIREYGNTFGVPMMWSRMAFHPLYRAKPFALGGSVGLIPCADAQRGTPAPGDLVVLIGGRTGNEGIHGASASSAGARMDEASVQIGAPLEQVKFRKAIVSLREAGCLRAITDVGGAGLNSAVGEIGEACGVWINTALVPLKTSALPAWRILVSESQERMILAVPPDRLADARLITARHQVRTTVIGRFSGDGRYCVFHSPSLSEQAVVALETSQRPDEFGEMGFDVAYELLSYQPPAVPARPFTEPEPVGARWPSLTSQQLACLLEKVVRDTEVASQHYADVQYDSTVQGNTAHGPRYGRSRPVSSTYWAATPVEGSPAAAVFAAAFSPWLFAAHPRKALRQMFCRLLARFVLAGVELNDVCLCDNFYTPHLDEHTHEWLIAMVDELAMLVRRFGTPVISGKDSSAGSTNTDEGLIHVPPAVFLSGLGKIPHVDHLLGEQWSGDGLLVRIGPDCPSLAGTAAGRCLGIPSDDIDDIDLDQFADYLRALAAARLWFRSGAPIGPGGLAARLVMGALASGYGVDLAADSRDTQSLFAEHNCGALVEMATQDLPLLPAQLRPRVVGRLDARAGVRLDGTELLSPAVIEGWSGAFAEGLR